MHPRIGVRLAEDQEVAVLDPAANVRREIVERGGVGEGRPRHVREDPQAAPRHGPDRAALVGVEQLVLAVPQKHEVQLEQPVQEIDGLAHLLRRVPDRPGTRHVDHVLDALLHRLEVPDDQMHLAEDPIEPFGRGRPSPGRRVADRPRSASPIRDGSHPGLTSPARSDRPRHGSCRRPDASGGASRGSARRALPARSRRGTANRRCSSRSPSPAPGSRRPRAWGRTPARPTDVTRARRRRRTSR